MKHKSKGGQPVAHMPEVAQGVSVGGPWQIKEGAGSMAADGARNRKQSSRAGKAKILEKHGA